MEIFHGGFFVLLILSVEVLSQDPFELTDVRLYTEGGLLFGGAVEVLTSHGWERVCYDGFNTLMGDVVCHKRGFDEGAMSVRPLASLGLTVNPIPSLACQFSVADGKDTVHCEYTSACTDHAVVICNYPGYLGCYRHTRRDPSLNEAIFAHSNMTIQFCLSLCRRAGYPYAGVAFGQECYCEAQGIDGLASRRLGNDNCFLPCVGDPLQNCGGGTAAGIYDSRLGSCNEVYTDVEGAIASPGFPGHYSNDEQCTWTVSVPDAANITVHVHPIGLYTGDTVTIANSLLAVAFTGGSSTSNIRFESSDPSLSVRLDFTFVGDTITVDFNSTVTSPGAQGVVLLFSSSIGPSIDPSVQINMTQTATTVASPVTNTSQPSDVTMSPEFMTSSDAPTARPPLTTARPPLTTALTDGNHGTAQTNLTVEGTVPITVNVEGASSTTTPRLITMIQHPDDSPSLAVVIAISFGIILIIVLILTAVALFTTSYKHDPTRGRRQNQTGAAVTNAAYAIPDENDGQTDSGIYDPGYDTADIEEPIYLSIRHDPRAKPIQHGDATKRESDGSYASVSRSESVKTNKTDHDYQSVHGLSRRNTDRSYLSLYPDSNRSTFTGGRASPIQVPSDTCKIAEDGYMVPTPKSSTQIQQTKL